MAVLTESEVRKKLSKNSDNIREFYVQKNQIITPSAKSYLSQKNIEIKYVDNIENINKTKQDELVENKKYKYISVFGAKLNEKPEHMTSLHGNLLVFKDHKRIILRGKIDSLESKIIQSQILCQKHNMSKLIKDLDEILNFVRNIMRCEVLEEKLKDFTLLGLSEHEIREQSHYPQKYFGIDHEFVSYKMGEIVVSINDLRSATREVELSAYQAFKGEYGEVERQDIIKALNRLSSLFWIMIYKIRTGKYD